jgi:hypothetical protein
MVEQTSRPLFSVLALLALAGRFRSSELESAYEQYMSPDLPGPWAYESGRWLGGRGSIILGQHQVDVPVRELISRVAGSANLDIFLELEALAKRLAQVETRMAALDEARGAFPERKSKEDRDTKRPLEEGTRSVPSKRGAQLQPSEAHPMKTPIVDSSSIAKAVREYRLPNTEWWKLISKLHPDAELFAIDADPRTFDVDEQGRFGGRADILVSIPKTTRSGEKGTESLTIPARVFGKLSPDGHVSVSGLAPGGEGPR